MNPVIVAVLIGSGIVFGIMATLFAQSRTVIRKLSSEVVRLTARIGEFESRLSKAEARATESESRLADAEYRANEFRRAVVVIGEKLDIERAKSRRMAIKLSGIIDRLLYCINNPGTAKEVDQEAIAGLMTAILGEYPIEQFVSI